MVEFSSSLKLIEIHTVDSPFKEDPKNIIFSREALILEERRSENLGKMGNNRNIYCYANREVVEFERKYQPLPSGTKILVMPQFSYKPDQILGEKMKKLNFQVKNFFYDQTSLVID